jgi:hypothetical protein
MKFADENGDWLEKHSGRACPHFLQMKKWNGPATPMKGHSPRHEIR